MKFLTVGTVYCDNEHTRELVKLWWHAFRTLNRQEAVMLIDAASPFDPLAFLPNPPGIFRWEENIGAITRGGKDGSGRSFCKAIEMAHELRYDYVVIYETDFIFAKPLRPIIERMAKANVKVANLGLASPYQFPEWGVTFLNVQHVVDTNYIGRYDWQTAPVRPIAEMRLESLFGDDLWMLPYRGMRNDLNQLNVENLANSFPYKPCSWLTHCQDINLYHRMLELNGVNLL